MTEMTPELLTRMIDALKALRTMVDGQQSQISNLQAQIDILHTLLNQKKDK